MEYKMTGGEMERKRQNREVKINREAVLQTLKCSPNQYPRILEERFPHVLENIVKLWNSHDGEAYIHDLLQPAHSGGRLDRQGFPENAWNEIYRLLELYKKPRLKPSR
jgi:hypothetical protein